MTVDIADWRPAPLLSRWAGRPAWLCLGAGVVAFLLGAASILAVAASRHAGGVQAGQAGQLTVAVRAGPLESADAAAARAVEVISALPGVKQAQPLDPTSNDDGVGATIAGYPAEPGATRLVSVELQTGAGLSASAVAEALRGRGLSAAADDHRGWTDPLERATLLAGATMAAVMAIALAKVFLLSLLAARAALRADGERINLMRRLGATEGFIGRLLRGRIVGTVALGAGVGAALAALAGAAMWFGWTGQPPVEVWLPSAADGRPIDLAVVLIWPVILSALSLPGAAMGVTGGVKRMPLR